METKSWHTLDKSGWGMGPWQDEPDKMQWADEETGLPCLMVRGPHGGWCGYVGVAPEHPLHGKDYSQCVWPDRHDDHEKGDDGYHYNCTPQARLEAHGGITFASGCTEITPEVWEKAKAKLPSYRAEAAKYPRGDAAEYLREWGDKIDDYETWREHRQQRAICHIPAPGESDNVWWFGFDCAHYGDFSPKYNNDRRYRIRREGIYRTLAYVQAECRSLAKQLAALANAT